MNPFRDRLGIGPPAVLAHRGDSAHAPENTLEAARLGHLAGAFAWELDVHLTRDGVAVVLHDDSLARTTDVAIRFASDPRALGGYRVSDFTWSEVRTLDAGAWFLDPAGGNRTASAFGTLDAIPPGDAALFASGRVRVPSLVEALDLTRSLDWLVNVELKSVPESDPALLGAVLEAIDRTATGGRVLLSSFDHDEIARAASARPEIPTGALVDTPLARASEYVRGLLGCDFLHASAASVGAESLPYRRGPSPHGLRPMREDSGASMPHLIYTVNDSREAGLAAHLLAAGAAGLFSDDPRPLVALGERR